MRSEKSTKTHSYLFLTILGGIVKIAFLFGIFHLTFSGIHVLGTALLISLLVGTVIGAIPSGGMVAEILIL